LVVDWVGGLLKKIVSRRSFWVQIDSPTMITPFLYFFQGSK